MAQRQLRILHVLGAMDPGGVESWLINVLKYMDRDLLEFHFCTFGPKPGLLAGEVERLGGRMLPCPRALNPWSFRRRFRKILREGKYDAVHSHVTLFSGVVLRWARAEGVPMRIAHSHTSQDDKPDTLPRRHYRRIMKSWIHRYATHGLAVSSSAAAELFGLDWKADARFRVLHCAIDLLPFREPAIRDEVRRELGLPLDVPIVGHVGRFVPAKNHRFLLEIFRARLKKRQDVHLLLVGDGILRPEIEAQAKSMGFASNVHFAGTRTDVPRLMRAGMDIFAFPSLWEGLPIAVIEAQAAGLCCLTSSSISSEVAVGPEAVAFMDLSASSSDWAEQVVQLLKRRRVSERSALETIAEGPFSMQRCMEGLAQVYQLQRSQYSPGEAFKF
jgi:glycosyltransferase involved in cell wall biosynthesis